MRRVVTAVAILLAGCAPDRVEHGAPPIAAAPRGAPCAAVDLTPLRAVRVDGDQQRFFVVAPRDVTDAQIAQTVATLERCTGGSAWAERWRLSVFTDEAMAAYKDDPSVAPAMADGRWAKTYVAEYDAARRKLTRHPAGSQ